MSDFPDTSLPGMRPHAIDLTRDSQVNKTPGVRVYQAAPGALALQLRSVGSTSPRRGGADKHIVSDVHLDAQQARRLGQLLIKFADQQKKGS